MSTRDIPRGGTPPLSINYLVLLRRDFLDRFGDNRSVCLVQVHNHAAGQTAVGYEITCRLSAHTVPEHWLQLQGL